MLHCTIVYIEIVLLPDSNAFLQSVCLTLLGLVSMKIMLMHQIIAIQLTIRQNA